MSRYDLTDFEGRAIEPLLPNKPRGVPRVDDRRVLNEMHHCYHDGLGGNGDLDNLMQEVNKLPLK